MRILKKTKQLQLLDGAIAVVLAVVGVAGYRLLWAPNFEVPHTVYVYRIRCMSMWMNKKISRHFAVSWKILPVAKVREVLKGLPGG